MKTNPLKGTLDFLPNQADLREYIKTTILKTYKNNGFMLISTPIIEDLENLDKSDGGDNLNLIFKIQKRGAKFEKALANNQPLCDIGLRYDLTLPLTRFFSANKQNLPYPFKCIQIDKCYRAEKPQKGRLREFTQCDIDILGDNSINCEIELINVTAKALLCLNIGDFTIKINDRKILNAVLLKLGFDKKDLQSICVSFDKLDKIGLNGVVEELINKGFPNKAIENFKSLLAQQPISYDEIISFLGEIKATEHLSEIISTSQLLSNGKYKVEFDLSLVRGQGYYTGTVFEIKSDKFGSSIAGGGRYDNLIEKFTGQNIPACGFSIGFERIFEILSNEKYLTVKNRFALIYDDDFISAIKQADNLRAEYDIAIYKRPKNLKNLLNTLKKCGFSGFIIKKRNKVFLVGFFI